MFQVASHPNAFHLREHTSRRPSSHHHSSHSSSHVAPSAIQLPRKLTRPPFTDISLDALASAAPDLAAQRVPSEFIRHGLRAKSTSMQAGLAASLSSGHLPSAIQRDRVPSSFTLPLRMPAGSVMPSYPTHVLAISPPSSSKGGHSNSSADVQLFAIHAVLLAAHCAKLPALPPARSPKAPNSLTLGVLPTPLPSGPAFAILHAWMYTQRLDAVLSALIPFPPQFLSSLSHSSTSSHSNPSSATHDFLVSTLRTPNALHPLFTHLASASGHNIANLMTHAGHVKELWQDMVALGVYDPALWDCLDLAWEVVLGAMNVVAA